MLCATSEYLILCSTLWDTDDKQLKYDMDKYECSDAQWIVDPHDWGMICGISKKDSTWRVVYGEGSNFSSEELRVRLPDKLRRLLPGSPEPAEYEVLRFSPYRVHQRCVDRMRIGRVVLVGDAAHLCNPMYETHGALMKMIKANCQQGRPRSYWRLGRCRVTD